MLMCRDGAGACAHPKAFKLREPRVISSFRHILEHPNHTVHKLKNCLFFFFFF